MCYGCQESKSTADRLEQVKTQAKQYAAANGMDRIVIYQKRGDTKYGYVEAGNSILNLPFIVEVETLIV